MSYLLVGMVVGYVLITIGLVTVLLYYGSLAYQCDALVGFWCHTDWKCAGVDGEKNGTDGSGIGIGTYDASGQLVDGDKLGCHLKGMYGVDPAGDTECSDKVYPVREINPCMALTSPDADRNDPDSYTGQLLPSAYPCTLEDADKGLCSGEYNTNGTAGGVNNITDNKIVNQSNSAGVPGYTPQYGLGTSPPPGQPFSCACYLGTNVIANSGTNTATQPLNANNTAGGQYNISGVACSQIINAYGS